MLWHAMPPELNTARLMAGAGPAPMLAAAAGWQTLSAALDAQAVELTARLNSLGEAWTGGGSDKALAAATPMVVWLQTASTQAKTRAMQATAQAANPSWRPPDHRHHKRQPERRSNRNHRRPTYPRTGHINPGAPHQHRPGQRCQSANPRPLRPDRLRPRPNHRPGLPPNTPDVRAGVTAIAQTPNETSGR